MAKKIPYLKSRNVTTVITYVIWCISLYAVFLAGSASFFEALTDRFHTLKSRDGLVVAMMPVLVLVLSGLISSNMKAVLVFWRIKRPLPGHRAFTKIAPRDPRINMAELKRKVGEWPRSEKDQNAFWYAIYKKHQGAITVLNSHSSFLLSRDLAAIALLFAIGGGIGLLYGGASSRDAVTFTVIMLAQYGLLAIVARNYGHRLVSNVLVEQMTS